MKRAIAVSIAALMVLGGAAAGHAKGRRVKVERQDSAGYVGGAGSVGDTPTIYVDEATFETERYERDVSVAVRDRAGQAVAGIVRQDADGDGTWELEQAFCGTTPEPVGIEGGAPVVVKVQPGPCTDGTPAVMTSGSIAVTFSGLVKPSAVPAPASPRCAPTSPREVTQKYVAAMGAGAADENWGFGYFQVSGDETIGGAVFQAGCGEGRFQVTLADQSGLPARAAVAVDPDGPQGEAPQNFVAEVCGAMAEAVDVTPGAEVAVFVLEGPCSDGTPAAATTGTATATLSAPAK